MGYTQNLGAVPDLSKIVISFWFYVPTETVSAAFEAEGEAFAGAIPLLVFGAKQNEQGYEVSVEDVLDWMSPGFGDPTGEIFQTIIGAGPNPTGEVLPPSFIRLKCFEEGSPKLSINIQTKNVADVEGYRFYTTSVSVWNSADESQPDGPYDVPGDGLENTGLGVQLCDSYQDGSVAYAASPANFEIETDISVAPDAWHHCLLSFDISGGCNTNQVEYNNPGPDEVASQTSSASLVYIALDGTNYTGETGLGFYHVGGGGPNEVLTPLAWEIANSANDSLFFDLFVPSATYQLISPVVGGGVVGMPAGSDYGSEVKKIRVAGLQIFTDVTIDTGVTENLRAFITADGTPASPTLAAELLGKQPEVRMKTSNDWITGNNRGTAGDFTPTGTITEVAFDP